MVDIKRLKKAHYAAAKIVEQLGEEYLIFFERINKEMMEAEKKNNLIQIAKKVLKEGTKL